jgi:prepilin-type N-terminal cleavage/methylation domain-containing protein
MLRARELKSSRQLNPRATGRTRGFTMIEIIMAMLVGLVLTAIAIPQIQYSLYNYRLNSAVAMSKWAIQSTRFQALEAGYPYQVEFFAASNNYQIQNEPTGTSSFQSVGTTIPLSSWPMTVNQNTTIQFLPNGYVTITVGSNPMTITYQNTTASITVSNYGNVSVSCSNNVINPTC